MANGFSTYLSQAIINATLVTPTFPLTKTLYLALFTADPTDDNVTANEVSTAAWTNYARQATGAWNAPSGNSTANSNTITFPAVVGAATVTYWGIYDLATNGNLLYTGAITGGAKTLAAGDVLTVAPGDLVITVD